MKYYELAGQEVSQVALGCMRIADRPEKEADAAIDAALEIGINFFDHANIYGGGGGAETAFADSVKRLGLKREDMFLQSKVGIDQGMFNFDKEHILTEVDGILRRLETDYLDFLLLHRPDTLIEPDEVGEAFDRLEESGKVRAFGVSNMNPMQMELLKTGIGQKIVANQLQFGLLHTPMIDEGFTVNMMWDSATMRSGGTLEYCRIHDIKIQPWSPLQWGYIMGPYLDNPHYQELNEALEKMAAEKNTTTIALALAWILRHPAGMQPLLGSMNADRIREAKDATEIELTRREWYDLYLAGGNRLP